MNVVLSSLLSIDPELYNIIDLEKIRQCSNIQLIASENFVSSAILEASSSILTNKYAEGYSGKRYYNGCIEIDKIENLAIQRAKILFKCDYVNVQPHSGSQANQAVFLALLKPYDIILGMSLSHGGHLTHGALPNLSGKWFNSVSYEVDIKSGLIDYNKIESLALKYRPKLIIAGYSSYPRMLDFSKFRLIADMVGAYLLVDISHIAGLVVSGFHQNPFPFAHVVTTTTHKTLRGPRGGLILTNDKLLKNKIDLALFPGLQGGPLMHIIAAKAVCFLEALHSDYYFYIKQVITNAKVLSEVLISRYYKVLTGGTDNHMILLDLRNNNITGKLAADTLEKFGIICNKNSIPNDIYSPQVTSGIRLGTAACTTIGFKESEFIEIGNIIADILESININIDDKKQDMLNRVRILLDR